MAAAAVIPNSPRINARLSVWLLQPRRDPHRSTHVVIKMSV